MVLEGRVGQHEPQIGEIRRSLAAHQLTPFFEKHDRPLPGEEQVPLNRGYLEKPLGRFKGTGHEGKGLEGAPLPHPQLPESRVALRVRCEVISADSLDGDYFFLL